MVLTEAQKRFYSARGTLATVKKKQAKGYVAPTPSSLKRKSSSGSSSSEETREVKGYTRTVEKTLPSGRKVQLRVSKDQYEREVARLKAEERGFVETERESSSGATTAKRYNPRTGREQEINPVTGKTQVTRFKHKVEGEDVSKDEYERYISSKVSEGKDVRVTTTKPVAITGKSPLVDKSRSEEPKFFDPEKYLADKYVREHPDMKTKEFFKPFFSSTGEVIGYEDSIKGESRMVKEGEFLSIDALEKANVRASALYNIEKDRVAGVSVKDPNKYGAGVISARDKKKMNVLSVAMNKGQKYKFSNIEENVAFNEFKYNEALLTNRPGQALVYATTGFIGSAGIEVANFPKNLALAVGGGLLLTSNLAQDTIKSTYSTIYNIKDRIDNYERLTGKEYKFNLSEVDKKDVDITVKTLVSGVSTTAGLASVKVTDVIEEVMQEASDNPIRFTGAIAGNIIAPTIWAKTISGIVKASTEIIARTGLTYVDPSDIFSAQTLTSGKLPTAGSSDDILYALEKTRTSEKVTKLVNGKWVGVPADEVANLPFKTPSYVEITHGTTANLGTTGKFIAGEKGAVGLEDPVTYFTVKGDASPLAFSSANTEYSFEPFSFLDDAFSQNRLFNLKVKGGSYIPDEVLASPGFSDDLANFYSSTVDDQLAYITKRGMLGKGELDKQFFSATDDFVVPTRSLTVTREGKLLNLKKGDTVKVGDVILEAGTGESELGRVGSYIFGEGETNIARRILKASEYTTYDGKIVLLSSGRPSISSAGVNVPIKDTISSSARTLTAYDLASQSGSAVSSNIVYVDPVSSGVSIISSTVSSSPSVSDVSVSSDVVSKVYTPNVYPETSSIISSTPSSKSVPSSRIISGKSYPSSSKSSTSSKSSSSSSIVSSVPSIASSISPSSPSSIISKVSSKSSIGSSVSPAGYITSETSSTTSSFPSSKSSSRFNKLFSVQVRKRGRWISLDKGSGLNFLEAHEFGKVHVGTSARASYRIVKAKESAKKKRFFGRGITKDFYRKGNIFIEKRGRRIKSKGELEEITFKGQRARKSKSIMSKMRLW